MVWLGDHGKPIRAGILKFQLSIRGAFYLTTAIAVYSAILALAYRGNIWGKGISFAVTCSIGIWIMSAVFYWCSMLVLAIFQVEDRKLGNKHVPFQSVEPNKPSPSSADLTGGIDGDARVASPESAQPEERR